MPIEKIKKEELLECIKIGMKNQEIADKYNLSLQGVKYRISALLKREKVRNRIELMNKYKKREVYILMIDETPHRVFENEQQAQKQALLLNGKIIEMELEWVPLEN